jgi:hypothetical protein
MNEKTSRIISNIWRIAQSYVLLFLSVDERQKAGREREGDVVGGWNEYFR